MRELLIVLVVAMTDALQKALQEVRTKINAKSRQRDQLSAEIAQLQATEIGLQNALGQQIQAEIAWTNLVRTVINQAAGREMSAVDVRDTLASWGYNFIGMNNPLAFFNTILQRLFQQGEVVRTDTGRPFRFSRSNFGGIGSLG
jgi:hypothetical protein